MPVLVAPTDFVAGSAHAPAERRESRPRHGRVLLIDNTKKNADVLLICVAELLRAVLGDGIEVVHYRKDSGFTPLPESAADTLASGCDFAIAAVGD